MPPRIRFGVRRTSWVALVACASCAGESSLFVESPPAATHAGGDPPGVVVADGAVSVDASTDATPSDDAPRPPGVGLLHTALQLQGMRAKANLEPWRSATAALLAEADAALARTPVPAAVFDVPSYYANPTASQAAKEGLRQDAAAAYALALAYQLADPRAKREQYAAKAIAILLAWATVNKSVSGADGDLVVLYTGVPLLYAADLVMNHGSFAASDRAIFSGWASAVFEKSAQAIKERPNNWGEWGTLGVVARAGLANDTAKLATEVARIQGRIASHIDASGELPEENKRTNSGMWYTFFALTAMTTAAQIAKNVIGANLFGYVAPNGRTIRLALEREFHYAEHPDQWPYRLPAGIAGDVWRQLYPCDDEVQIPTPGGWPGSLFEIMSDVYGVAAWKDWVEPKRPSRGYHGWIYATLMRETP
jgi:hypothetical protein